MEASVCLLLMNIFCLEGPAEVVELYGGSEGGSGPQSLELFGVAPALFVENRGQYSDAAVRYVHDGSFADVAVMDSRIRLRVERTAPSKISAMGGVSLDPYHGAPGSTQNVRTRSLQFSMHFVGAQSRRPVGLQRSESLFHYCVGEPPTWRRNVPAYEVVIYEDLYEGVDLQVKGLRDHLKYEFHVQPGADYCQIAVRYDGIGGLSLAEDGSLRVDLGKTWGVVQDDAPYIYQEIHGQRVEVSGRFILLDERTYSFAIAGNADPRRALVIDPALKWSTYLGGSTLDNGYSVAVDADHVYVTGETNSQDWTSGGFDPEYNGGDWDAFVVKLHSNGAHVWSTYLGGDKTDFARSVTVDESGGVYVTGQTASMGWSHGGFDTTHSGGVYDAFVAKLSSSGAHLWSTYLGASNVTAGRHIVLDALSNVYVTGVTDFGSWTSGGFDTSFNGGEWDAFLVKLGSDGTHVWSTYLGGAYGDDGFGLAITPLNQVCVTGRTESSGWLSGGFDTTYNGGGGDAFVAALDPNGAPLWSTCFGGGDYDGGCDIAVDASGALYIAGITHSSGWPSGGFDTVWGNGGPYGFLAKLSSDGAHIWSTYLGGDEGEDYANSVCVSASGAVYVTGSTTSDDWISGGFDTNLYGQEAFVVKATSNGAHVWSSYMGRSDTGYGIAVDPTDALYVTGRTFFGGWASGGFDTSFNGGWDAFVAKITECPQALHDWNGDGIVSIIGDVPPFVDCVYFSNCPSGLDTVAVGDCSGDSIISIVGDVPCFVNCVYFGTCPD